MKNVLKQENKYVSKELKSKIQKQINDYFERKYRYEFQKSILKDRNSYSKTDHDATFMRMKEDHMKNGQLKPGYNLRQIPNLFYLIMCIKIQRILER